MTADESTDLHTPSAGVLAAAAAATPDTEAGLWPSPAQEMIDAGRASRSHPRFPDRLPTQSAADWIQANGTPMPPPAWADIRMPWVWSRPEKKSGAESRA